MLFGGVCFSSHEISSQLSVPSEQRSPSVNMTRGNPFFSFSCLSGTCVSCYNELQREMVMKHSTFEDEHKIHFPAII